jgi:allophanate hydrolase subunit 2
VQLIPSGELVVMLADHPTTGGYPVIAVAHPDDVDGLAQTAANATLTLT